MTTVGPGPEVLVAFGVATDAQSTPLSGGEETSVVVGGVVFKRVQDSVVSRWCQAALAAVDAPGVRIPEPRAAVDGSWDVDGWIATELIEGLTSLRHRPDLVIEAGLALTDALVVGDVGPVLQRGDRWARADRFAWGEEEIELDQEAAAIAVSLQRRMSSRGEERVIVHGDLSANVFADPSGRPVVLDFTPYVRPRRIAAAIVVADHLLWYGGGTELRTLLGGDDDGLARALLFRLVSEQLADRPRHGARLGDYERALGLLGWA